MGKKTRTRRTKWRRLSLGEASGPEEEDDETQQPEDFSADHALVLHSDDLSLDEQFAVSQEHSSSSSSTNSATAATATATGSAHIDVTVTPDVGAVNSKTSGPEEEQPTDMMVSNHQVNHPQQQTQSRGPSWKLAANQGAAVAAAVKPANPAYYNVNNGYPTTRPANNGSNSSSSTATGNMSNANPGGAANGGGFRRGGNNAARYNNGSYNNGYGNAGYGRANSWNSSAASSYNGDHHHHHHHHHHQQSTGLSKMHGIEKKIFNDEEYTKISTPRQEVLFKKGSIGAKKRATPTTSTGTATSNDSGSEQDSVNGNAASPVSPAVGDDPFPYGNDSGSTGDASSTTGETQSPDASAVAAASGAALQTNYDGAPLVCFPMYDFYGGYSGMYPGSTMLVQTYPGGPIVAAVPVPVPVQTIDWYRGAGGGAAGANGANPTGGEVGYYYALGYPAGSEMASQPETSSSSRRNSLESYQASSQEVTTGSEGSENSSPCSTGPSSQGPASPQGEMVSPAIDPKAQTGGGVATATAAAAVVMDMNMDNSRHQKMAVAGFVYPYPAYGLAPPALFASGVCDPNSYYYDDECGQIVYYEDQYDEEAMDLNPDAPCDELYVQPDEGDPCLVALDLNEWPVAGRREGEEEAIVQPPDVSAVVARQDGGQDDKPAVPNPPPAGTGRRKKRRKKRNKMRSERSSQPRVTDEGAAEDEEVDDDEDAAAAVEPEKRTTSLVNNEEMPVENDRSNAASPTAPATISPGASSPAEEVVAHPLHSSLDPSTLSSPLESESVSALLLSNVTSTAPLAVVTTSETAECRTAIPATNLHCLELRQSEGDCLSLADSSAVLPDLPDKLEHPVYCSTPSSLESFAIPAVLPIVNSLLPPVLNESLAPPPEQQTLKQKNEEDEATEENKREKEGNEEVEKINKDDGIEACFQSDYSKPLDPDSLIESSTPVMVAEPAEPTVPVHEEAVPVEQPVASHLIHVQDCNQLQLSDAAPLLVCPDVDEKRPLDSGSDDSIVEEQQQQQRQNGLVEVTSQPESNNKEDIDPDSLDSRNSSRRSSSSSSASSDEFVYLQLDERDETNDVYFDDEPGGTVGQDPAPDVLPSLPPQLWRTVILEESEPNSREEMSPILCGGDSGIVAGSPSPPVSVQLGPITTAVSQWLQSAPIQQQLIAGSRPKVFEDDETDDGEEEDYDDDDDHHYKLHDDDQDEEATDSLLTVPKNGLATLRTAPFSDDNNVTDGLLRRVDSVEALPLSKEAEEAIQPVTEHCDPAKYSVYYQLGVSVELDDGKVKAGQLGEKEEEEDVGTGNDSLLNDSDGKTALIKGNKTVVCDESIEQCPLTVAAAQCQTVATTAEAAKKRRKRHAWRRILLLHRAVHKSRREGDKFNGDNQTKRLKSGPSCCAIQ